MSGDADRGLQPERTVLAHARTVLASSWWRCSWCARPTAVPSASPWPCSPQRPVVMATVASLVRQRELRTTGTVHASSPLELGALAVAVAVLQVLAVLVVL